MFILVLLMLLFLFLISGYSLKLKFNLANTFIIPLGLFSIVAFNHMIALPFIIAKINSLYYSWVAVFSISVFIVINVWIIWKYKSEINLKKDVISVMVQILLIIVIVIWQTFRIKDYSIWDIRTYGTFVNYLADNNPMNYYNLGTHDFGQTLNIYNLNSFYAFESLFVRIIDFRELYSLIIYPLFVINFILIIFSIAKNKLNTFLSVLITALLMLIFLFGYQPNEYATGTTFVVLFVFASIYLILLKKTDKILIIMIFSSIAFSTTTTVMVVPFIVLFNIIYNSKIKSWDVAATLLVGMHMSYAKMPSLYFLIVSPIILVILVASFLVKEIKINFNFKIILICSILIFAAILSGVFWRYFYWNIWTIVGFSSINDSLFPGMIIGSLVLSFVSLMVKIIRKDRNIFMELIVLLILNPFTMTVFYRFLGTAQPRIAHIPFAILVAIIVEWIYKMQIKTSSFITWKKLLSYFVLSSISIGLTLSVIAVDKTGRAAIKNTNAVYLFSTWGKANDGFSHEYDDIYKLILENSNKSTVVENISNPSSMEKINLYKPFLNSYNGDVYVGRKKPGIIFGDAKDIANYLATNKWGIKKFGKIIKKEGKFMAII